MDATPIIIGITGVSFLLLYLAFQLEEEHIAWKLFSVIAVLSLLLLIPKVIIDIPPYCDTVIANQSITETFLNSSHKTDFIENEYDLFCSVDKTTPTTFHNSMMWIWRIFLTYIFIYFIYVIFLKKKLLLWGIMKDGGKK